MFETKVVHILKTTKCVYYLAKTKSKTKRVEKETLHILSFITFFYNFICLYQRLLPFLAYIKITEFINIKHNSYVRRTTLLDYTREFGYSPLFCMAVL